MNFFQRLISFVNCLVAVVFLASNLQAADLLPLTDNQKPPYLAVWKEPKYLPEGLDQYNAWLNRKLVWADISPCVIYKPAATWAEIEFPFDKMWGKWVTDVHGRRVVIGLDLLPTDGSKLDQAATGAYDSHFTALAQNLVANNLGNAIICMGPTSPWGGPLKATSPTDAAHFVQYWQHIVKAMKAVPGTDKLQFDWVAEAGRPEAELANSYPGDDCVDLIGATIGEGSGDRTVYPYPPFSSNSEMLYRQKRAWDETEYPAIQIISAFAKTHNKRFSIARWYLNADHTRSEGFDAAYFIEAMAKYIQDPANNVYFASYFEYYHNGWLSPTNDYKVTQPQAEAAFKKMFALPSK